MSDRPVVLDVSILVKGITFEEHSEEACALLATPRRFLAPDLMPIEFGNVLWKKVQRGLMVREEAMEAQRALASLCPVRILPSAIYHERALAIALAHGRSFYDSLYLAVAEMEGGVFVTADERLVNGLKETPLASSIHWIGASLPAWHG